MPFKVTEMPNGKMQYPGIRCVILLQTFSENWLRNDDFIVILVLFHRNSLFHCVREHTKNMMSRSR
jgi:hypothetical protein